MNGPTEMQSRDLPERLPQRAHTARETETANSSLAGFRLLADPETIARGMSDSDDDDDRHRELAQLRSELARRSLEIQELRQDLSLALTLKSQQEGEREALRSELVLLREEHERRSEGPEDRGEWVATLEARDRELASARELIEVLQQSIDAAHDERRALEASLESRGRVDGVSERELARLRDEIADERERSAQLAHELRIAEDALCATSDERDDLERRLSEQDHRVTNTAAGEREALAEQLTDRDTQIASLSQQLADASQRLAALRGQLDVTQNERRIEIAHSERELALQKDQLAESRKRERELLSQAARGEQASEAQAALEREILGLRSALGSAEQRARTRERDAAELQATLAIARDTLEGVRAECARLRSEIKSSSEALAVASGDRASLEARLRELELESEALRGRLADREHELAAIEQTLGARDRETAALRDRLALAQRALEARDTSLAELKHDLATAASRISVGEAALATAQADIARARAERAEVEDRCHGLREALAAIGASAAVAARSAEAISQLEAPRFEAPRSEPSHAQPVEQAEVEPLPRAASPRKTAERASHGTAPSTGAPGADALAEPSAHAASTTHANLLARCPDTFDAIARFWRDAELRRLLADREVEGFDGLCIDAIASACERTGRPARVGSLSGGDLDLEIRLASALASRGLAAVRIDCWVHPSQLARKGERVAAAGLGDRIALRAADAALLRIADPIDVMIADGSLGFADRLRGIEAWLARVLGTQGVLIAAGRQQGLAPDAARRASEMGDRIWALMPDRYKRNAATGQVYERFSEAAAEAGEPQHPLGDWLAEHFRSELAASFGHLASHFVLGPVAGNFDPAEERDRRFIEQVASLDQARIESGLLPALFCVVMAKPKA